MMSLFRVLEYQLGVLASVLLKFKKLSIHMLTLYPDSFYPPLPPPPPVKIEGISLTVTRLFLSVAKEATLYLGSGFP